MNREERITEVRVALEPILKTPEFVVGLSAILAHFEDNDTDGANAVADYLAVKLRRRLPADDYVDVLGEGLAEWLVNMAQDIRRRSAGHNIPGE